MYAKLLASLAPREDPGMRILSIQSPYYVKEPLRKNQQKKERYEKPVLT